MIDGGCNVLSRSIQSESFVFTFGGHGSRRPQRWLVYPDSLHPTSEQWLACLQLLLQDLHACCALWGEFSVAMRMLVSSLLSEITICYNPNLLHVSFWEIFGQANSSTASFAARLQIRDWVSLDSVQNSNSRLPLRSRWSVLKFLGVAWSDTATCSPIFGRLALNFWISLRRP